MTLDATYLGGYAVECSLKALILEFTPEPDRVGVEKSQRFRTHVLENLGAMLKELGRPLPLELVEKFGFDAKPTRLRLLMVK